MRTATSLSIATVFFLSGLCSAVAQQPDPNVCAILAERLTPDVLIQGSSSQQFMQLQTLIKDQRYDDFSSAMSKNNSFSLGFSIPDEVDLAIGDNQHSNSSNWQQRRDFFLKMSFQQSSSAFQQSSYLSQTSSAVVAEITNCAQTIANLKANGVFVTLDAMSPNRDSFAVQIAYRTDGNPNDWALTDFHVEPDDPKFKCNGGFESASDSKKMPLTTLKREIGCAKSQDSHLTLVVNTSQGGGTVIQLDSLAEEIKKLREDFEGRLGNISTRVSDDERQNANSISKLSGDLQYIGPDIYQCPPFSAHAGGSLGGGSWGYYGCVGQITTESTCTVIEWPHNQAYQCTRVGRIRYAP